MSVSLFQNMLAISNALSCHFLLFREIVDNTGKENGIDLIMGDRTYHLIAESPEDARYENHQAFLFCFLASVPFCLVLIILLACYRQIARLC